MLETFKMPDESEIDKDTDLKTLFNKISGKPMPKYNVFLTQTPIPIYSYRTRQRLTTKTVYYISSHS